MQQMLYSIQSNNCLKRKEPTPKTQPRLEARTFSSILNTLLPPFLCPLNHLLSRSRLIVLQDSRSASRIDNNSPDPSPLLTALKDTGRGLTRLGRSNLGGPEQRAADRKRELTRFVNKEMDSIDEGGLTPSLHCSHRHFHQPPHYHLNDDGYNHIVSVNQFIIIIIIMIIMIIFITIMIMIMIFFIFILQSYLQSYKAVFLHCWK